jgi:hypothetical protein
MSRTPTENEWQQLYREALLESDPTRALARIEEAHKAVQRRALELGNGGSPETKERHELDAALYFLGLLRGVWADGGGELSS